jgi:hypothetical protein
MATSKRIWGILTRPIKLNLRERFLVARKYLAGVIYTDSHKEHEQEELRQENQRLRDEIGNKDQQISYDRERFDNLSAQYMTYISPTNDTPAQIYDLTTRIKQLESRIHIADKTNRTLALQLRESLNELQKQRLTAIANEKKGILGSKNLDALVDEKISRLTLEHSEELNAQKAYSLQAIFSGVSQTTSNYHVALFSRVIPQSGTGCSINLKNDERLHLPISYIQYNPIYPTSENHKLFEQTKHGMSLEERTISLLVSNSKVKKKLARKKRAYIEDEITKGYALIFQPFYLGNSLIGVGVGIIDKSSKESIKQTTKLMDSIDASWNKIYNP